MGHADSPALLFGALLLFFLSGVAIIAIAYVVMRRKRNLLRTGRRTTGTIVGIETRYRTEGSTRIYTLVPIATFSLPDGELIRFTSTTGTSPTGYREGQTVEIVYDPSASAFGSPPYRATIVSFWQLWTAPILLLALGLGSVLFAMAFALLVVEHGYQ